jgi:hypothetical protein
MATAKQIAANRANAQRSTGPRTAAGKARSSQNAFKHGFSLKLPPFSEVLSRFKTLHAELADKIASEEDEIVVARFVHAQLRLTQIHEARRIAFEQLPRAPVKEDIKSFRRLAALDRYERYALTERSRATREWTKRKNARTNPI